MKSVGDLYGVCRFQVRLWEAVVGLEMDKKKSLILTEENLQLYIISCKTYLNSALGRDGS